MNWTCLKATCIFPSFRLHERHREWKIAFDVWSLWQEGVRGMSEGERELCLLRECW